LDGKTDSTGSIISALGCYFIHASQHWLMYWRSGPVLIATSVWAFDALYEL
jgi:hypothetical protein